MKIWDIHPGYLNRKSLLTEHTEIHKITEIIKNREKAKSKKSETLRWLRYGWALKIRHRVLSEELFLRGYQEESPVVTRTNEGLWPSFEENTPFQQIQELKRKRPDNQEGVGARIPLPGSAQEIWSHHKYSVLARNVALYEKIGREVSGYKPGRNYAELANMLVEIMRTPPAITTLNNALQHMWGHVSDCKKPAANTLDTWSIKRLCKEIQLRALEMEDHFLLKSTALSELMIWVPR